MTTAEDLRARIKKQESGEVEAVAPMHVHKNKSFACTVQELLMACEANPDHPNAKTFRKAVKGQPPQSTVRVDMLDLEAVLDDKDVEEDVKQEMVNGQMSNVHRKRLVPRKKQAATASAGSAPTSPKGSKADATADKK